MSPEIASAVIGFLAGLTVGGGLTIGIVMAAANLMRGRPGE